MSFTYNHYVLCLIKKQKLILESFYASLYCILISVTGVFVPALTAFREAEIRGLNQKSSPFNIFAKHCKVYAVKYIYVIFCFLTL